MGLRQYLKGLAAACCLAAIAVFGVAGSMLSTMHEENASVKRVPASTVAPAMAVDAALAPEISVLTIDDEEYEGENEAASETVRHAAAP